jgi:homoserine kinase
VSAAQRVIASAPGSIGNFGPGLDILGCAVSGVDDSVVAEWCDAPGITLRDPGHPDLPSAPAQHASALAAQDAWTRAVRAGATPLGPGIALSVEKNLPLSGGQGGSAASAVAGAAAVNALFGGALGTPELLEACLTAEEAVAGRHLDNIAPSLLGGIVLIRRLEPPDVVRLPVPPGLLVILAHPAQQLRTADARRVLPATIDRATALYQAAQVGAIVSALHSGDLELLGRAIDDRIAEPARAPLIPGFVEAKAAAMRAGALGASISGAGPTMFALAASDSAATAVRGALRDAFATLGIACTVRIAAVDGRGVRVRALDAADASSSEPTVAGR